MKKFKVLSILIAVVMLAGVAFAETPSTLKRNVWNAKQIFKHGIETNNNTRSIPLQLHAAVTDTGGTIAPIGVDGTTAPGIAAADSVPAIIWATSAEKASIGWSFMLPADYSTGLSFRMLVSSSSNTSYANLGLNWGIFVNNPNTIFDAASYGQTIVMNANPNPSTSNSYWTFTANTTALADMAAGDTVTVWFGGGDGRTTGATTEVKSVEARYTAVQ